ncbi:hypothetical protein JL720_16025 [Aureococcus anophagefferens]|nr:hypothetical protein JL720_16025 [Aureococcus anophagefferens]
MLEIALYSLGLYLLGAHNVPVLDVACFTGYNASYFMLKTGPGRPAELEKPPRREIVVLVFGVLRASIWVLGRSA